MFDMPFNKEDPVSKCVIPEDKITVSLQSDSDDSSNSEDWIHAFCLQGKTQDHKDQQSWFCEIDPSFFDEELVQINKKEDKVWIDNAIELIGEKYKQENGRISPEGEMKLQCLAEHIYGLFHAKYILTEEGLKKMREKFLAKHWGTCPRYYCYHNPVLPYGQDDRPGVHCAQVYCPVCSEVYDSSDKRAKEIDGAYFGPTFALMFCKFFPELSSSEKPKQTLRIHGFQIADYKNKSDFFTMTDVSENQKI